MKVTKYPQSCLLIEKDGHRIVIDPGNVFTASYKVADLESFKWFNNQFKLPLEIIALQNGQSIEL